MFLQDPSDFDVAGWLSTFHVQFLSSPFLYSSQNYIPRSLALSCQSRLNRA